MAVEPTNFQKEKPAWAINIFDGDGEWGWDRITPERWWSDVLPKLQNFETMTWAEIEDASGGRSRGNNSHPVPVENLCKEAQKRLAEKRQDDVDDLFSLRLDGTTRIWGIKDGRVLKILWFDPDHEVCPVTK